MAKFSIHFSSSFLVRKCSSYENIGKKNLTGTERVSSNRELSFCTFFASVSVIKFSYWLQFAIRFKSFSGVFENEIVQEIVQYGHYVQFKCCARNTTEITWSRWSNDSDTWVTLDPNVDDVNFLHHKQIMSINSAGFDDKGFYKCNIHAKDISTQSDKKFELEVIACDVLARGPFPIAPLPCSETVTNVESTLTLPCSGYFGCGDGKNMRVVTWLVSPLDEDDSWEPVSSVDGKRYVTKNFNRLLF